MITFARVLLVLAALTAGNAVAICPVFPAHYRVGADGTYCTHNDIQSAINAVGSCPIVIDITREHLYGHGGFCTPGQTGGCHLSISGKTVTLQGWGDGVSCYSLTQNGCADCGPGSTAPLVTLDGDNSGGPVLTISGTSGVSLGNLTLTHGDSQTITQTGTGGGIDFNGAGSLSLSATTISLNAADLGAGINVAGSGAGALLTLNANTIILSNSAVQSGGGIRLSGNAHLVADQAQTLIGYNHAVNGSGGGLLVLGPAIADIGSPGYGSGGTVFGNDAVLGGGVAVYSNQLASGSGAHFYTTDPQHPVAIEQNFASSRGGAIYAKGNASYDTFTEAYVCMSNYRIIGNGAPDGAIAYLDTDSDFGSRLLLNQSCTGPSGVACARGVACNQIRDNVSQDGAGQTTNGAAIVVGTDGAFVAKKLDLRGSTGDYLMRIYGYSGVRTHLDTCLIADNTLNQGMVYNAGLPPDVDNCTITATSAASAEEFNSVTNSILFQPGTTWHAASAMYVLANDKSGLPYDPTVGATVDPLFVDPANGDYHLQLSSLAVDYTGGSGGTDLDGYPRDVDLAVHYNSFGPRDLGPYEKQSLFNCDPTSDVLFCSSFELTQ